MADPRLNSIHLDGSRRQEYRRAREALLAARGWQTLAAENQAAVLEPLDQHDRSDTLNQERNPPVLSEPTHLQFWLRDRDHIYPLKVGLNTVGRAPENDIVLQDCYVSRRHCAVLVHANQGCEVHDTASKNGTYLNGRRIGGPSRLAVGDEIRMCDRQLVFCSADETRARPGEPPDSPTMVE